MSSLARQLSFYVSDEMNWVEITWTMMIAASLMLGVVHVFVWQKQPSQYANLLFFVLAVSAAAYGAYELERMRATTPVESRHATHAGLIYRLRYSSSPPCGSFDFTSAQADSGSLTQ